MNTILKQDLDLPSNVLVQGRARSVCFREVALSGTPLPAGAERRPPPRACLQLVAYDDGTYGVLLNGHPLPDSPWPADQLDRCIHAFQSVGREGSPPATEPSPGPGWAEDPAAHHHLGAAPRPG